ncbi:MAG TPA: polysaccharide deacetylase family protein [Lacunisphaera sp.]|nr:polysaccharide deacetylase family protein [Lacunisphaera sp.]
MSVRLALKIDVDTDRGTRLGVANLLADLRAAGVPATFLFSLGPDQTGRAITRVLRPGFLKKVGRTSIVELYGVRTLLNGTLLPAPHIGRRNAAVMRSVRDAGFEIGIHCYNHYRWQDHVHTMGPAAVQAEFDAARAEFRHIFGTEAGTAGAAGWQANAHSRAAYDRAGLLYASDTRGTAPFFAQIEGRTFATLEIPSTLPTLDELMGRPEYPDARLVPHLLSLLRPDALNVYTLHAEIEGMGRRTIFQELLAALKKAGVAVVSLEEAARELLARREAIPVCDMVQASVDGRSGLVATQGPAA